MQCAEQVRGVAKWLSAEAKRRKLRRTAPPGWWEFTENHPAGVALSSDPSDSTEPPFAIGSVYPRRPWVLVHMTPDRPRGRPSGLSHAEFDVIAYFGRVRGGDVHGRTRAEKQGKRLKIRPALRSPALMKAIGETIFIDAETPLKHIADQLAVFCLRRDCDPDGSLRGLVGLNSSNEIRRQVAARVIKDFTDPTDPRSYPGFLKTIRERILVPELDRRPLGHEGADSEHIVDWKCSPEDSHKRVRPKKSNAFPKEISVARAAVEFEIPRRTLYEWIHAEKLRSGIDSHGRRALRPEDVQDVVKAHKSKTRSLKQVLPDASERADAITKMATAHNIQRSSARKRINRALAAKKPLPEFLLSVGESE
jgi:hypothetical protein